MSEIVVPDGWEMLEVQDAFLLGRGRVISKPEIQNNSGIYPVYSSQSKDKGIMGKINTYDFDGEYITWTTDGAYAGTVFYRSGKFNCTNVCGTLKDKGIFDVEMRFIARYLSTVAKNHVSYIGNPKLMNGIFSEIPFLLPPLPEQQKIASILTSVDEVIEKTQSQINKLQDLKKGTMNELLTKGIGHTEFKDSPVGKIPVGWDVKTVGEIASAKGGKRLPKGKSFSLVRTNYPYIRVSDFENGTINKEELKYVDDDVRDAIARYTISSNDLYISIAGSIGIVGIIPDDLEGSLLTENAAKLVILKSVVCRDFLKFCLNFDSSQSQFNQEKGTGGGVPKLALFRICEILVPLPPLPEQQKIASILSSMDSHIEEKQRKLEQTQSLKKSLMQDLLTGKVRVTVH